MNKEKSKKDLFRERFSKRYPDVNLDDEDAYYDGANRLMDEYDGYEANSKNLRERMTASPAFAEMVMAANAQTDFDPVVWMVQNKGLDLQALADDPDYAKKLADAHNTYLEKRAKADEIETAMAANMPASVEAIRAKAAEMGLTDEQAEEVIGRMYQVMDDLIVGKMDAGIFELIAKGMNFDAAVETAREEGVAQGVSKKVDDKLRTLANKQERVGGSQRAAQERKPKEGAYNPFLA